MLFIPNSLTKQNKIDRSKLDSLEDLYGVESTQQDVVKCPLVKDKYIIEGECYDFQAFAQGLGNEFWRQESQKIYHKVCNGNIKKAMMICISHQLEIAIQDGATKKTLTQLESRLDHIQTK